MSFLRFRSIPRALLIASLAGALGLGPDVAVALQSGDAAPGFSAPTLKGQTLSLAGYRGKVVYLDFWASWCAPCATSLPLIDALRDEFASGDFAVLAVNVDRDRAKAEDFLRKRPIGYPSVLDPQGELPVRFGVKTMPTSFLIDRQGVIRYVHRGFRKGDEQTLRAHIRELLAAGR